VRGRKQELIRPISILIVRGLSPDNAMLGRATQLKLQVIQNHRDVSNPGTFRKAYWKKAHARKLISPKESKEDSRHPEKTR
jgi:hypothetical protein